MAKKKKKAASRPEVPHVELAAPTEMGEPRYEPMSVEDFEKFTRKAYELQLGYAPQVTEAQRQAQDILFRNMSALQREQGPYHAAKSYELLNAYNPQFIESYQRQRNDLNMLERNVRGELAAGYELGPHLGREVEQAVRGAQTARGNILGAAPTAQEAFGKGQAATNLYQQRLGNFNQFLGQQQNYLQGRNPMDMLGQTAGTFMGANYYPSQAYVDTGLGGQMAAASGTQGQQYNQTVQQGYSSFQNALQQYNSNQLEGAFGTYDRQAESWMYDESVRRGLYSTPSVGGGGGMGGGMMGTAMAGIGSGVSAGIGLAAAGAGTGTALAGGAAAAISAAGAAICWLARKYNSGMLVKWREFIFTDAPDWLRRKYLYSARLLAPISPMKTFQNIGG